MAGQTDMITTCLSSSACWAVTLSGGDVDAAAVQALHGNCKSDPPRRGGWRRDLYIVKSDHAGGLGVPAHLVLLFAIAHPRGIRGNQQMITFRALIAGTGHHHQNIGVTGAGDKDLAAVDGSSPFPARRGCAGKRHRAAPGSVSNRKRASHRCRAGHQVSITEDWRCCRSCCWPCCVW